MRELPDMLHGMFQSTHPVRGATCVPVGGTVLALVSIHAPREGCDKPSSRVTLRTSSFNPRTP